MQITFRASPKLLKVGEIGESIVESDDSFRKQFSILILGAVRTGKIPFRNKNGFKLPLESLEISERETRDFAKRRIEAKLPVPICEFDADLHHVIQIAAAQPWMNVETQLQALAAEGENHRQWVEAEIETETDRLLDGWYRDGSVLVSEAAEWFCKEHDFEGTFVESSIVGNGEIARKLAKWFDKSIGDLPQKPRSIAEAYIPEWPELSAADRRARADEADLQLQATLGHRFEQANSEKEQAKNDPQQVAEELIAWYAVTLDAMTWWGMGSVTPREAAMLLCRFNPHDDELDPLSIATDETGPDDYQSLLRVVEDVARLDPQNRTLAHWQGIARDRGLKHHSWIDVFGLAVASNTIKQDAPVDEEKLKRSALIKEFEIVWPTIRRDLNDSGRNELSLEAKHTKYGFWKVKPALTWANQRGRIINKQAISYIATNDESNFSVMLKQLLKLG